MTLLKRIPIRYRGELHDVRLINFTVDKAEVEDQVPPNIRVRDFGGRAMISMVDVKLENMRPLALPFFRFRYRHIAFRLLVDDSKYNNGESKGIYFLRAFTDKRFIVFGGSLMTDYKLQFANISETDNEVTVEQGSNRIRYCLGDLLPEGDSELRLTVGALDRAYSTLGATVRLTQIQREKWPIQLVECAGFENSFFKNPKLVGAFRVLETIYYDWLPPKAITV